MWSAIVSSIITGLFSIAVIIIQSKRKEKREDSYKGSEMAKYSVLYTELLNTLQEGLENTGSSRILIVKVHNCNERPMVGSHLYTTVVSQAFNPPARSIRSWEQEDIDAHYAKFLNPLTRDGLALLNPKDFPDGHPIKYTYERSKIEYTKALYLTGHESSYCFIAFSFKKGKNAQQDAMFELQRHAKRIVKQMIKIEKKNFPKEKRRFA